MAKLLRKERLLSVIKSISRNLYPKNIKVPMVAKSINKE